MTPTHKTVEPAILYLGTPVILNSTLNPDGSYNLAPISSVFWLGWRAMLGFEAVSQTAQNIIRTGECVINLPSQDQVDCINRLSRTTGSNPVPAGKALRGYRYEARACKVVGFVPVEVCFDLTGRG
jgi:flavin reductase (DIM6/NTAB) family NADH-FMN oxidoreductase RutF